jgi:hypothetical protein
MVVAPGRPSRRSVNLVIATSSGAHRSTHELAAAVVLLSTRLRHFGESAHTRSNWRVSRIALLARKHLQPADDKLSDWMTSRGAARDRTASGHQQ